MVFSTAEAAEAVKAFIEAPVDSLSRSLLSDATEPGTRWDFLSLNPVRRAFFFFEPLAVELTPVWPPASDGSDLCGLCSAACAGLAQSLRLNRVSLRREGGGDVRTS